MRGRGPHIVAIDVAEVVEIVHLGGELELHQAGRGQPRSRGPGLFARGGALGLNVQMHVKCLNMIKKMDPAIANWDLKSLARCLSTLKTLLCGAGVEKYHG